MSKLYKLDYESPIGVIEITGTDEAISSIMFSEQDRAVNNKQDETPIILENCYTQLDEYFKGERREFTFPIKYEGTDFQKLCGTP